MLLTNAALSSNVFLSFLSLSASYPFRFSPFITVFPLQMLLTFVSVHRDPFIFCFCHLLDVAVWGMTLSDSTKADFWLILDTGIIFRNTVMTNNPCKANTRVAYTVNPHYNCINIWNIQRSSDLSRCYLLESFYSRGGGWLIKSACFWWSELAMDAVSEWVSEQAWVKLPIYWGRENTCSAALARRVSPLQHPIQLPLMRAALFASVSPIEPHALEACFKRSCTRENGQISARTGCASFPVRLAYLAICSIYPGAVDDKVYRCSGSFLHRFLSSVHDQCSLQVEPEGH